MLRFGEYLTLFCCAAFLTACGGGSPEVKSLPPIDDKDPVVEKSDKVVVAYVTSWANSMPDPDFMTHINYAFGHVTENFSGVGIANEERLKSIVKMLQDKRSPTKLLLSIGGWGSGRFSEMAADATLRGSFARDCMRVIKEYSLAGVDIDWEFPTSGAAGISSSPDDTRNFTLLMKDIRAAIGTGKLLTLATSVGAGYIDLRAIEPYVDFVNIMAYDMAMAPAHHSALYPSKHRGWMTADEGVKAHLAAGMPAAKLTLGMPFYGHGSNEFMHTVNFGEIGDMSGYTSMWDDEAKVPYYADATGKLVFGYENPRSLKIKCEYINDRGLLGGMYWDYGGDNNRGDLRKAVYEGLILITDNN